MSKGTSADVWKTTKEKDASRPRLRGGRVLVLGGSTDVGDTGRSRAQ